MPSDALSTNIGRLNNSIEKILPMLNAVITGSKQGSNTSDNKNSSSGSQKSDPAIKAMSSGVYLSFIVDNASSKELIKATGAMNEIIKSAGEINRASVDEFKNSMINISTGVNSLKKITAIDVKSITALNKFVMKLLDTQVAINAINPDSFDKINVVSEKLKSIKTVNLGGVNSFLTATTALSKLFTIPKRSGSFWDPGQLFKYVYGDDFDNLIYNINKVKNLNTSAVSKINILVNAVRGLNALTTTKTKIHPSQIAHIFSALGDMDVTDVVKQFNAFAKINSKTAGGVNEFFNILSSLNKVEKINVSRSIRMIKKIFRKLNGVSFSLDIKFPKSAGDAFAGFNHLIESFGKIENIHPNKIHQKLKRLNKAFWDIREILETAVLGYKTKDGHPGTGSVFSKPTEALKLKKAMDVMNDFCKISSMLSKSLALTGLIGPIAAIGALWNQLIFTGTIKILNKLTGIKISENISKTLNALASFGLKMAGITALLVLTAKLIGTTGVGAIVGTLALFGVITAAMVGVAAMMKKINVRNLTGLKSLSIFAAAMAGTTAVIVLASKLIKGVGIGEIAGTVALFGVIGVGLIGVAKLANFLGVREIKGVTSLSVLALTMVGVSASIILISTMYAAADSGAIWATLGLMAATAASLVLIGGLSALMAAPISLLGAVNIGILALITVGYTVAIINLAPEIKKVGYGDILKTLGIMTLVSASLIGVGALMVLANPIILPSLLGAIAISALAIAMTTVVKNVIEVDKIIKANKELFEVVNVDGKRRIRAMATLEPVFDSIFSIGSQFIGSSWVSYRRTKRTIKNASQVLDLVNKFTKILTNFNKSGIDPKEVQDLSYNIGSGITVFINITLQTMAEAEESSKKTIRQTRRTFRMVNKLFKTTDKFLDMIREFSAQNENGQSAIDLARSSATNIALGLRSFIDSFFEGMDSTAKDDDFELRGKMKIKKIRRNLRMVRQLLDIVPSFLKSIKTASELSANSEEIGVIATNIGNSITAFTNIIFEKFGNDNKKTSGKIRSQIRNFKNLMSPVTKFAEMVSSYRADSGKLAHVTFDSEGNAHVGEYINTEEIAGLIALSVTMFTDTLYDSLRNYGGLRGSTIKRTMQLLESIGPINTFIDAISKYGGDSNGNLIIYDFNNLDESGNPKVKSTVDIKNIAGALGSTITTFLSDFYSNTNIDNWNSISGKNIRRGNRKIGKLIDIIDPLTSFTEMLSAFGSDDKLYTVDESGKRTFVNVTNIANAIASNIRTFLDALYSHSDEWTAISGIKDIISSVGTNMKLGKLGKIIDPINSFMTLLTSYKWDGESLIIKDSDGSSRTINLAQAGTNIANGITAFTESLYADLDSESGGLKEGGKAVLKFGRDFKEAFDNIDKALKKSDNDKRITELKKLGAEFKNLANNIDKMVSSSNNVAEALNKVNINAEESSGASESVSTPEVEGYSDNSKRAKRKNRGKGEEIDLNELGDTVTDAITVGIQDAFKNLYKFKVNCVYDKTMQELILTRSV